MTLAREEGREKGRGWTRALGVLTLKGQAGKEHRA